MVTYYFPPLAGAGSLRAVKLARYLPQAGWDPVVLTVKDVDHIAYDPLLGEEVPPTVPVIRTGSWDPTRVSGIMRALVGRLRGQRHDAAANSRGLYRLVSGGMRSQVESWLFFPDSRVGWLLPGLASGVEAGRSHEVQALFSSSPPVSCHLLAYALKQKLGVPWVADFRDGWTTNPAYRAATPLHRRMAEWLERQVMREADRILTASAETSEDLERAHGALVAGKLRWLPNGFDPADFAVTAHVAHRPSRVGEQRRFTITHTGILYGERTPRFFLEALAALVAEQPEMRARLRVVFVGTFPAPYLELLERLGLGDVVEVCGYVSHRESVAMMLQADVLLLVMHATAEYRNLFPAKVFEYVGSRRPVLALAPEGSVAALLREAGNDQVVPPDDVDAIKAALLESYRRWEAGRLPCPNGALPAQFTRQGAAAHLAAMLDELTPATRPGTAPGASLGRR